MAEKYPLDMLIKARKIREDNAQREVAEAKNALEKLEREIENKKKEVEEYEAWRKEEEVRRFIEIQNSVLSQREIERFKWGIAGLKTHLVKLEEEALEMEGKVEPAKQKIEQAVGAYKDARNKKEKIEEHKEYWKEEQSKEATRLEDLELEEFIGKKPEGFSED